MPSLRETLTERFDVAELHVLLDELGLAYDDLPGDGKPARVVAALRALRRRGEIPRLLAAGRRLRPDIAWDAVQDTPQLDANLGGPPPCYVAVPHRPVHFVGRETELADLRRRLLGGQSRAAITALDGKPGVGKTTLAVEMAWDAAVLAHFWGGVLWASLGPKATPDASLGMWAAALGVSLDAAPTLDMRAALVQSALAGRPFLLVLDDVWAAEQVYPLLQVGGPGCAHVLTTRDEGLAREFADDRQRVAELNEDEAVDLLARTCPLAAQVATDGLRRLARGVGGLPLALDLVGGYLRSKVRFREQAVPIVNSLQQAAAWLELRHPRRQDSLDAIIGLSVDALPDDAYRTFPLLAGFAPKPAGFDRVAACAVTGASMDALAALLDHNLLEEAANGELALHQTLAEAARRRADQAGLLRAAELRHAEYYAQVVAGYEDALKGGRMTFAAPLAWDQVTYALDRLTRGAARDDDFARLLLRYARKWANVVPNNHDRRRGDWLRAAVAAAQRVGDESDQAITFQAQGEVYRLQAYYDAALPVYARALALFEQVGDQRGQAGTLKAQGDVYRYQARYDEAMSIYARALELYTQVDDRLGLANTLLAQGDVLACRPQNDEALDVYGRALALYEQVNSRLGQANTLLAQGDVYLLQTNYDEALAVCTRALELFDHIDDRLGLANTHTALARIAQARRDFATAQSEFKQAGALYEAIGDYYSQGRLLVFKGDCCQDEGQPEVALQHYAEAVLSWRSLDLYDLIERYVQPRLAALEGK